MLSGGQDSIYVCRILVGLSYKNNAYWQPLVERMISKLAGWKGSTLTLSGRLVLKKLAWS